MIGCRCKVCLSTDLRDKRLRTSLLVEVKNAVICMDTSPDFRRQMLRAKPPRLDAILYTHEHADHTAGIDDIRPFNAMQQGPISLYAMPRVIADLKARFAYIFEAHHYPGLPEVSAHRFTTRSFSIKNVYVQPIPIAHGKLSISGFRIQNLAYLTDVKSIKPGALQLLKNLDVLIISALRKEKPHHTHLLLHEALDYIEALKPKRSYITHISHEMGLHAAVEKELPKTVFLAYDQLRLDI
ncbi:MAG: MBL fold metallo-hydrolase [Flavobacteriales bacterium]